MDKDGGKTKVVEHVSEMPTYAPPGHSGTSNVRLIDRAFAGNYELVIGTIEPGGIAGRHSHGKETQAMYVIAGAARVALGDAPPETHGPGTIFRIPPGLDHAVESLGPEPLRLLIVYSPPLPRG
ncbi:MAG TPA: cupin domain-containing protein [Rhodospirillales bacterium]|jgi:quercetin dioxygenase-like cupin family protein